MKIFVTGGAGYIGSHVCAELLLKNHDVMVFDSLVNSSKKALERVESLTKKKLNFIQADIRQEEALVDAIRSFHPSAVIHFAGVKSVNESVINPLYYYDVNVCGSINLLKAMDQAGCHKLVFSSSATVYDCQNKPPFDEQAPVSPISAYGVSKLIVENILKDWVKISSSHKAVILRYFNPVGAHCSGLIGEDPKTMPTNLLPLVAQVAIGKLSHLSIYGNNYDTRDGTPERDYIHVMDLAYGHLRAIEVIDTLKQFQVLNLGKGKSVSVRELISIFEQVNNITIPTKLAKPRIGDVPVSYANTSLASKLLGFECKKNLEEVCVDAWNWIKKNPDGY